MQVQFYFDSRDVYDTFLKQNRERETCCGRIGSFWTDDDLAYRSLVHNFLCPAIAPFTLTSGSTEHTLELFEQKFCLEY